MPSSANRRRVEIPAYLFDRVQQIADAQQRTVASVVNEILFPGVTNYQAAWLPSDRAKLNGRAARALDLAEGDEPRRFDHNYVGTEHLLLALIDEGGGVAAQVLRDVGVDHEAVSGHLVAIVGRGKEPIQGQPTWAPRFRIVLGLALREARNLDHGVVGTGHLLLGLTREGQGIAAGILQRMGVALPSVSARVMQALTAGGLPLSET
jgi:ATP-dependent Clp protease ATP-binding subunit ClpC